MLFERAGFNCCDRIFYILQDIPLSDILSVHSSDSSNLLLTLDHPHQESNNNSNPKNSSKQQRTASSTNTNNSSCTTQAYIEKQQQQPSTSSNHHNNKNDNSNQQQPKHAFEIETVKLTYCVGQLDDVDDEEAGVGTVYSQAWEMAIRQALMPVTPQSSFPLSVSCANMVASGRQNTDNS